MKNRNTSRTYRILSLAGIAALGLAGLMLHAPAPVEATGPNFSFVLTKGRIVPGTDYAIKINLIGAAITSSGRPVPVTAKLHLGDQAFEPFGEADSPEGNVNQDRPVATSMIVPEVRSFEDYVTVTATSWNGSRPMYTRNSSTEKAFVKVLRNGDALPDIAGFDGQEDVEYFLRPYLSKDGQSVWIHPNQVLYLFELGTSDASSAAADFQDLVVLVTLGETVEELETDLPTMHDYAVPMRSAVHAD